MSNVKSPTKILQKISVHYPQKDIRIAQGELFLEQIEPEKPFSLKSKMDKARHIFCKMHDGPWNQIFIEMFCAALMNNGCLQTDANMEMVLKTV